MRNNRSEFVANIVLVQMQATPRQAWTNPAPIRAKAAKRSMLAFIKALFNTFKG